MSYDSMYRQGPIIVLGDPEQYSGGQSQAVHGRSGDGIVGHADKSYAFYNPRTGGCQMVVYDHDLEAALKPYVVSTTPAFDSGHITLSACVGSGGDILVVHQTGYLFHANVTDPYSWAEASVFSTGYNQMLSDGINVFNIGRISGSGGFRFWKSTMLRVVNSLSDWDGPALIWSPASGGNAYSSHIALDMWGSPRGLHLSWSTEGGWGGKIGYMYCPDPVSAWSSWYKGDHVTEYALPVDAVTQDVVDANTDRIACTMTVNSANRVHLHYCSISGSNLSQCAPYIAYHDSTSGWYYEILPYGGNHRVHSPAICDGHNQFLYGMHWTGALWQLREYVSSSNGAPWSWSINNTLLTDTLGEMSGLACVVGRHHRNGDAREGVITGYRRGYYFRVEPSLDRGIRYGDSEWTNYGWAGAHGKAPQIGGGLMTFGVEREANGGRNVREQTIDSTIWGRLYDMGIERTDINTLAYLGLFSEDDHVKAMDDGNTAEGIFIEFSQDQCCLGVMANGAITRSTYIALSLPNDFWFLLEQTNDVTAKLSAFTNRAKTTHAPGSPVSLPLSSRPRDWANVYELGGNYNDDTADSLFYAVVRSILPLKN